MMSFRTRSYRRPARRMACTDTTPVKNAFAELRKAGYFARMNFWCCSSCAWYDVPEAKAEKVVFYNKQSNETLQKSSGCMLQWAGDSKFICQVLEKHGVVTQHDGTQGQAIEILVV